MIKRNKEMDAILKMQLQLERISNMNTNVRNKISHNRSQSTMNKLANSSSLDLSNQERSILMKELDQLERYVAE